MNKPKFKVGDKVRILDGSKIHNYAGSWTFDMKNCIGEIATIKHASQISGTQCYRLEEFGFYWDERGLELVDSEIIIYRNGAEVIAKNIVTGKTGVARCSAVSEFNFNIGAKLAFERLINPKPKKPKYYSGKVVCVNPFSSFYTKGKVYEIKDGVGRDDEGDRMTYPPVKSFEELSQNMSSEFIELVE